ncbi:putative quinol monooxygenase [Haladaptatus sp. CMAA 1911]|uniref:putative quinol monooxygenase n=1 Tax=unclassified Haladaptatus TaxID=2622732 RepID=UPI003753F256
MDPERRADALETIRTVTERSQTEDGVVNYWATTDVQNPNRVRFFEQYESVEAVEKHVETDHYAQFNDELADYVDGEMETIQARVEDVDTVQFGVEELLAQG